MAKALYVHIPFCAHICRYCDFSKVLYRKEWALSYLQKLFEELDSYGIASASTIYVGGGTPTALEDDDFEALLRKLSPLLEEGGEFTVEGNPENLSENKLRLMRRYGVNRLSLGAQSSHKDRLASLGRLHDFPMVEEAVRKAKEAGFRRISVDLIYGLSNESMKELDEDIDALFSLDVEHLSTYCLSVPQGTAFFNQGIREMEEGEAADQYERILKRFRKAGYERYEVSNFARGKGYSRHNLSYWRDKEYYGIGLGASGYLDGIRYTNTRNLQEYLQGKTRSEEEKITPEEDKKYFFLTNLRLAEGFSLSAYEARFGASFLEEYKEASAKLCAQGLLKIQDGRVVPTDRGILLLDRVLLELF